MNETNCPFFGRFLYVNDSQGIRPFLLLDSRGNQCALVTDGYAPCQLEIEGREVDWHQCPLLEEVRA